MLAALAGGLLAPVTVGLAAAPPTVATDAHHGIQELMGTGDGSPVGWDSATGLWGGHSPGHWWQSALALWTLVRYASRTHDSSPAVQRVVRRTYYLNDWPAGSQGPRNFTNRFMDDTAWWALAWLAASQYERYVRHDRPDAVRFLNISESDASYIAQQPRPCGGLERAVNLAPGTITNAQFAALAAGLGRYLQAPGIFHSSARASSWLRQATSALAWLRHSGLIDIRAGRVKDHMSSSSCQDIIGQPITYTEGELADALVQIGEALHKPSYYAKAANFLRYTTSPASGFMNNGILQDHCQAQSPNCAGYPNQFTVPPFKGIFMQAVADWSAATGSHEFSAFVRNQATAITRDDISGASPQAPGCATPQRCQFGFDWSGQASPMFVTVGTQTSALAALTAALP